MSTLSIESVSVARGPRNVVHDVTIEVPPGEVTTILGPNGAGKSSLALACAGLARVTKGWINLDGKNLANMRPERIRAAGMSVVPEGRRLLPNLTVQQNAERVTVDFNTKSIMSLAQNSFTIDILFQ